MVNSALCPIHGPTKRCRNWSSAHLSSILHIFGFRSIIIVRMNRAVSKKSNRDDSGVTGRRPSIAVPRRTTITLSAAAHQIVERFKSANGTSTSSAIDEIIQRSEPKASRLKDVNGFLVLSDPPKNTSLLRPFTVEDVKDLEDAMDREYVERLAHVSGSPRRRKKKVPSQG